VVRRPNQVASGCAAFDPRRALHWIDSDSAHKRTIDHDPVLAQGTPGKIVPATTHSKGQVVCARPLNRCNHVLHSPTANKHGWAGGDPAIPQLARCFVGRVVGAQQFSTQACGEVGEGNFVLTMRRCHGVFFLAFGITHDQCTSCPIIKPLRQALRRADALYTV
jgi:hypothetical protein